MMTTYYAVCNVGGSPISVRIDARTDDEAREVFERIDQAAAIDCPRMDAEEDLGVCGDSMSEEDFAEALRTAGYTAVGTLDPVVIGGTTSHLAGGWRLWRAIQDRAGY